MARMTYDQLKDKIDYIRTQIKNSTSVSDIHYWGMELLVFEEILEKTIDKGRR